MQATPIRLKLDSHIKPDLARITTLIRKALYSTQADLTNARLSGLFSPNVRRSSWMRQAVGSVHEKQRFIGNSYIPLVFKGMNETSDVIPIILLAIVLLNQDLFVAPIPDSCPVFVRPAQAERKFRLARRQHVIERTP